MHIFTPTRLEARAGVKNVLEKIGLIAINCLSLANSIIYGVRHSIRIPPPEHAEGLSTVNCKNPLTRQ